MRAAWLALSALALPGAALAQAAAPLSEVVVLAPTPLPGGGVDRDKTPIQSAVLSGADITRDGAPDAVRALDEQVGAVNLDSASGNPYQPTLVYHGFQASPLQGVAQGLAVYVGGVRFNQAFGDTVNWDLIPSNAIDRMVLEDSNPVFGLNVLGGALNVRLKTGFSFQGGEADLSGGSFGQAQADVQYGRTLGEAALYLAASAIHQAGWRDLQASDIENLYGDLGWRRAAAEVHLNLTLAKSALNGPGTSPVQLLAADPSAQFTAPNAVDNSYGQIGLSADVKLGGSTSVQAEIYDSDLRQHVVNGNAPSDVPCTDGSGLLCSSAGDSATLGGAAIPAFLGPSPFAYAQLDVQTTNTNAYGASLQVVNADHLFGLKNHAVAGASFDGAQTGFAAAAYVGGLTPITRVFVGPGVIIDEPGQNTPVRVAVSDAYAAAFASDTLELTHAVAVTASARFNTAQIDLNDRNGGDLTGAHAYVRLNPALGVTYQLSDWLSAYAGYAEANRAPTPAELSCAGPADSCSLANFFVGDPGLRQVVAHTFEVGVRGGFAVFAGGALSYDLGLYRADLDDDIVFINSATLGRAYFANIPHTRRQGLDADLQFKSARWTAYLAYSHTEATYRSGFVEAAGDNPAADAGGELTIRPGDRFPGAPADQVKLGFSFKATDKLSLGAAAVGQGGVYLFGDEANLTPRLRGFFVVNLNASYQLTRRLQLFARIENLTDATYDTYGTFAPTSSVYLAQAPGAANPRAYSPAAPIGGFGGVRLTF
jgi:outer membrane receptor protein involved in Fe transport